VFAVCSDLRWLAARSSKLEELRDASSASWLNLLAARPNYVLRNAKDTFVLATAEDFATADVQQPDDGAVLSAADPRSLLGQRNIFDSLATAVGNRSQLQIGEEYPTELPAANTALATAIGIGAQPIQDLLAASPLVIGDVTKNAPAPQLHHVPNQSCFHCGLCDYVAFDMRSLAAHSSRKHHYAALATIYAVANRVCGICLTLFPSRMKLVNHLRCNKLCLVNHVISGLLPGPDSSLAAVADHRRDARENRRLGRQLSYARSPILTLCSPMLPIYAPRDRGLRSSNALLRGALDSANVL
jgi:hypothetical protein